MSVGFQETMRGTLLDAGGEERPVEFKVAATRVAPGDYTLRGVVHVPPWAPEAPASGTLSVDLLARSLSYRLNFPGKDGRPLELVGHKTWSPTSPLRSLTHMVASLRRVDGTLHLDGEMAFPLRFLPGFLLSWLTPASRRHRVLDVRRRALERHHLFGV
jgi:hypothetical protein